MPNGAGLALYLLESLDTGDMSAKDLCSWLYDAVDDLQSPDGTYWYCCYCDHIGDGESGNVIFQCNGDLKSAPYQVSTMAGKQSVEIDLSKMKDVAMQTTYIDELAPAAEARRGKALKFLKEKGARNSAKDMKAIQAIHDHTMDLGASCNTDTDEAADHVPGFRFTERNISQDERDAAKASDFAGKNKSFPILKKADVSAAASSIGRAGDDNYSTDKIKANIIRIAKRKGWASELPKAWQDDKEAAAGALTGELLLRESGIECCDVIPLRESARSDYEFKLIAPGAGSSAYYTPEALRASGPKVFKAKTHMYWNHATETEEAARPEGDLNNLAAVLTTDAYYRETHPKGPGLYARGKVFADYAERVAEKGEYIGLSIRAAGNKDGNKLMEGKPVLKEFVFADSTDFVTKAGAGGLICMEAARPGSQAHGERVPEPGAAGDGGQPSPGIQNQESNAMPMTEQELAALQTQLRESQATNLKLNQRFAVMEAGGIVDRYFATIRVGVAVKERVKAQLLAGSIPMTETGNCDEAKLKQLAEASINEELQFLNRASGGRLGSPVGMNAAGAPGTAPNKKALKEADKDRKRFFKESAAQIGFRGKEFKLGRKILEEGRSAFDVTYNSRVEHGRKANAGESLPVMGGNA